MSRLGLFEGFGVEIELMIVDAATLDVRPVADTILDEAEIERGELCWSNELVLHVVELKTNGPAAALAPLPALFQRDVGAARELLAPAGATLLGTGMHPWMDPDRETVLWPHEYGPVYRAFDRVFSCRGHGWSNLQSVHLNLPFGDDDEFRRLHAAIRLVLPLLPALAASTPVRDGAPTGLLDSRLDSYRRNARRVPEVGGRVVPESVAGAAEYAAVILEPMYRAMEPHDPAGILRHEWLNARGAIARFDRGAIEIRLLDAQECPRSDVALCALAVEAVRFLVEERAGGVEAQLSFPLEPLDRLLRATTATADATPIDDEAYRRLFGLAGPLDGRGFWRAIAERAAPDRTWDAVFETWFRAGPLARRILTATGPAPDRARLREVYGELSRCLAEGELFAPA